MIIQKDVEELFKYEVDEKDFIYYCFEKKWISEKRLRLLLGIPKEKEIKRHWYGDASIAIDETEVLDSMWDNEIIDYIEERGHVVDPYIRDISEEIIEKEDFVKFLKNHLKRHYTKTIFNKEDLKREICDIIDNWSVY